MGNFSISRARDKTGICSFRLHPDMDPIELVYYPRRVTVDIAHEFRAVPSEDTPNWLAMTLCHLVESWNVTRDKMTRGTPVMELLPNRDAEGNVVKNPDGSDMMIEVPSINPYTLEPVYTGQEPVLDDEGNPVQEPYPLTVPELKKLDADMLVGIFFCIYRGTAVNPPKDENLSNISSLVGA